MDKIRKLIPPMSLAERSRCSERWKLNNPGFLDIEKKRRSLRMKGDKNPSKRVEVRKKIRLSVIKDLEKKLGTVSPNYNPQACEIINWFNMYYDFNFQHALNGGECRIKDLGYWPDGYDEDNNTVIEIYEPRHKRQLEKDNRRKQEIINYLECHFMEIWI